MKTFKGTLEECNAAIANLNTVLGFPNSVGTATAAVAQEHGDGDYSFVVEKDSLYNALTDSEKENNIIE
tara:strand:- start:83 stop:289 length:207 start_codon:yes stop_codon:yes gene_type:complete